MCSIFLLRIKNHVLPYLVGPTALEKRQSWKTNRETLAFNVTVHPPMKISMTKAEEANNEPVPKKARSLTFMEYSCQAPIGCSLTT